MVVYIKYSRENKTIELIERFRSPGSTSQQSPAVYAHCVMTGSLPPPFIGTFVCCPLFCYRPCVGSITAPYAALPIQLVTYLWHATFYYRRVILVVYHPLMFCRCMLSCTCMCVCLCPHTWTPDPQADPLPFWSCCFLSVGTWSPREGLVEAAVSTQCSPQTSWKTFHPALCCLFKKHSSLTRLLRQIASFVFYP